MILCNYVCKMWLITKGFTEGYLTVVRPVLICVPSVAQQRIPQYQCVYIWWNSLLKRAFKAIYPESNYVGTNDACGPKIRTICKPYFNKMLKPDHKLHHLLPDERVISRVIPPGVIPYVLRPYPEEQFAMHIPMATKVLLFYGVNSKLSVMPLILLYNWYSFCVHVLMFIFMF